MRLRTSRPKSSASAELAEAEINCLSGCWPKYHAGNLPGREFAFAVARRDQEHQPVDFVAGNTLELLGDLVMDRACLVARVRVLSEAYLACRTARLLLSPLIAFCRASSEGASYRFKCFVKLLIGHTFKNRFALEMELSR